MSQRIKGSIEWPWLRVGLEIIMVKRIFYSKEVQI
ncbi:hypothetical protein PAEAM_56670 [Paenibacillus sp. GM1FR]|nr:hypothetical protein PAEAM_56670 [Paenibacillus sp. GM1FR]